MPMGEITTSYYLRLKVADQTGVLASITKILAEQDISIDALLQKEALQGQSQTDLILFLLLTLVTFQSYQKRVLHQQFD
jgi:homoserine dehydrogenase